jgi:hypothetical protein
LLAASPSKIVFTLNSIVNAPKFVGPGVTVKTLFCELKLMKEGRLVEPDKKTVIFSMQAVFKEYYTVHVWLELVAINA